MRDDIRSAIREASIATCIEEYVKAQKIPNVSGELTRLLERNGLTIHTPEIFAELVYETSHALQNYILEHRTRPNASLRTETIAREESNLRQQTTLRPIQ